jgi:uncharacterized protein
MNGQPINEYILKVASRCNLNCDYCYEYHLGDDSWKRQPKFVHIDTAKALAARIVEHATKHRLPNVMVSLHGGEPLLLGARRLDEVCTAIRREVGSSTNVELTMQTNATLVSADAVEVIKRHNISVSVSIDGYEEAHDRHRVDHAGQGTFGSVERGILMLRELAPECISGLLAVIDLRNDPVRTFDAVARFGINWIDFLLPHHHWDRPPPRPTNDEVAYGRWYWEVYQAWTSDRHPSVTVRFLANLVSQLAGGAHLYEAMTLAPCTLVTIATDGAIEGVDCLKSTGTGAQQMGFNIFENTFDEVLSSQIVSVRQSGEAQLAPECVRCEFKAECAGGYFPHRWGRGREFSNPSVFCADLFWLAGKVKKDLTERRHRREAFRSCGN